MADDPRGLRSHFDALMGTEWLDDDPEHARVRVAMRDELRDGPAEVFLQVPPCVPATPNATTGGTIEASDMRPLLEGPGALGVAELMNYPGAVAGGASTS